MELVCCIACIAEFFVVFLMPQVVIVFTNDSTGSFGPQKGKLRHHAKNLAEAVGAKIVPVAVGDRPKVHDLELIASENKVFRTQLEDHAKLGRMLLRGA